MRQLLLDPGVAREFERLKKDNETKATEIKALKEELQAVGFSQESKAGRMLMLKCRALQVRAGTDRGPRREAEFAHLLLLAMVIRGGAGRAAAAAQRPCCFPESMWHAHALDPAVNSSDAGHHHDHVAWSMQEENEEMGRELAQGKVHGLEQQVSGQQPACSCTHRHACSPHPRGASPSASCSATCWPSQATPTRLNPQLMQCWLSSCAMPHDVAHCVILGLQQTFPTQVALAKGFVDDMRARYLELEDHTHQLHSEAEQLCRQACALLRCMHAHVACVWMGSCMMVLAAPLGLLTYWPPSTIPQCSIAPPCTRSHNRGGWAGIAWCPTAAAADRYGSQSGRCSDWLHPAAHFHTLYQRADEYRAPPVLPPAEARAAATWC